MSKFGFGKDKKSETAEFIQKASERNEELLEEAKLCLHSESFKMFVSEYEKAERDSINALIRLSKVEFNDSIFVSKARYLLSSIVHFKSLLDAVHEKAGEKYGYDIRQEGK